MKLVHTFQDMLRQVSEGKQSLRLVAVNPTDEATKETLQKVEDTHLA